MVELIESYDKEVVEETDEYKIVKDVSISPTGKKKIVFKAFLKSQGYNPSTSRWGKSSGVDSWSPILSDFSSAEEARDYLFDKYLD